jgi:hypothetical protein
MLAMAGAVLKCRQEAWQHRYFRAKLGHYPMGALFDSVAKILLQ